MAETEKHKTVTIGDRPAKEDTLGFKPYVIAIAKFLTASDTKPPLTISIEGEWGRGKSSFMEQLQEQILQEDKELEKKQLQEIEPELQQKLQRIKRGRRRIERLKFERQRLKSNKISWFKKGFLQVKFKFQQKTKIVWFNAWRHDKAESLWAAFALSFLAQISTNGNVFSNVFSYLKLFRHRFDLKRNPWKFVQTFGLLSLNVIIFFVLIFGSLTIVYTFGTRIIPFLWKGDFASARNEPNTYICELINKFPEFKTIKIKCLPNNPLGNILLFLVGTGLLLAGIGTLIDTLGKLIGNPKTDLTQYLKSPDYDSQIAFIEKFHEDFSKIVNAYAGKGRKVYVFIDDLDRCELGKSADLLQALNLMISNDPNLIFILGMDREKVAAAITFKQKDVLPYLDSIARNSQELEQENHQLMKKLDYGFAFLEKFVQLSFSVPKPSENTLEIFLKEFFPDKQQNSQEKQESTTPDNSHTTSKTTETTEPPKLAIFPLIQKEPTSEEDITKLVQMVAPFFDYNPRRLKQYLNVLRLRSYITYYAIGVTSEESKDNMLTFEQLGKFVAITLKYPRLLRRLEEDNELLGKLEDYARSQSSPSFKLPNFQNSDSISSNRETEKVKDWIDNDSKLKELLGDGNSLADNKGIKKLLTVSSELKLDRRYLKLYLELRQFLEEGKWKEADEETFKLMLQVADREDEDWLDVEDIDNFPCEDLRTINQLWLHYSDGKFGFSVQKEIYESLGGTREYNYEVWKNFGDRVGWRKGGNWLLYSDLTFDIKAPQAQLPVLVIKEKDASLGL